MSTRGAKAADVRNALVSAAVARWQSDRGTWRVEGGVDTEGDELTVIAVLQTDVVVVTIF
jgi:hypothetical protein